MAMIDHFRLRGAMVVATTHYDALKSYAATTEGVTPAGFGFDPATFAPTYRLNYGAPGSSLALEIATRLGLPASIIEKAREHRSDREAQLAEHLAKVERDIQSLEHERRLAARERESLEEAAAKLQAREQELQQPRGDVPRRLDERIEDAPARRPARNRRRRRALKARTDAMAADAERRRAAARDPDGRNRRGAGGRARRGRRDRRAPATRRRSGRRRHGRRGVTPRRHRQARPPSATASASAGSASRGSSRRCTIARRKSTSAASGCARASTSCGCSRRRGTARLSAAKVRVNVELQPRERLADRAQRHRLQRRRSAVAHREVPRRGAARRAATASG